METTGGKASPIARAETSDVLEIQQVADTYSTLITAVRKGDVETARRHSLAGALRHLEKNVFVLYMKILITIFCF